MSGRQAARLARVNHQACATALRRLEEAGLVQRQGSGQSQLFRLNRQHVVVRDLVLPLLAGERELFRGLLRRLGTLVAGRCARAMVFGSVARGEEASESDLDLLLIAEGPTGRRRAREAAGEVRAGLWKEWGVRVNAIVLTSREVELRGRRRDPLIGAILREGIVVGGDGARQRHARTRTAAAS